jgi:hypothetical protein
MEKKFDLDDYLVALVAVRKGEPLPWSDVTDWVFLDVEDEMDETFHFLNNVLHYEWQ